MKQNNYVDDIYHVLLTSPSSTVLRNKLLKIAGDMVMGGFYSDLLLKAQGLIKVIEGKPSSKNVPAQFKAAMGAATLVWETHTFNPALKGFITYVEKLRVSDVSPDLSREQLLKLDKETLVDMILSKQKGG